MSVSVAPQWPSQIRERCFHGAAVRCSFFLCVCVCVCVFVCVCIVCLFLCVRDAVRFYYVPPLFVFLSYMSLSLCVCV